MSYTRKNVWGLGDNWASDILWYARGVGAMRRELLRIQPVGASTVRFMASTPLFGSNLVIFSPTEAQPSADQQATFWNQCQHGTWYFLPWHRGYVLAFEANIRAEVIKLKGPAGWALPYWNYFNSNEFKLPPAFATADWPDGKGNNPLFVPQRYGPGDDGNVYVPLNQVNLKAMGDPDFTGVTSGGSPGFGGVDTGFAHGGEKHGGIETQPHDWVHGLVGGGDQQAPGLMSDPDTAALDPIFWLHHANIDRLWEVWRNNPPTHVNPTSSNWLKGPARIGERSFAMPMPDETKWVYTPAEMVELKKLNYDYDDISPAVPAPKPGARLLTLGLDAAAAGRIGGTVVQSGKNVELVGATAGALPIEGRSTFTHRCTWTKRYARRWPKVLPWRPPRACA